MLKRFGATSPAAADTPSSNLLTLNNVTMAMAQVLEVPANSECAIVTMDVQNMASVANIAFQVKRDGSVISTLLFQLDSWGNLLIDNKEFLEAGDSLWFGSDKEGLSLAVSCDISEVIYED